MVIDACNAEQNFGFLYDDSTPLIERITRIATEIYGADGVTFQPDCKSKIDKLDADETTRSYCTCMVKTHLSLSHDPKRKGRPKGWVLPITDVKVFRGAGFVVPIAGNISLMPGTASDPAFRRIDIDTHNGKVKGLF
jgi:formate--tetrahydrofolate ligase